MKRNFIVLAIALILTGLLGAASMSLAQQWDKKADMPTARYSLSAVGLNGLVYAIGGRNIALAGVEYLPTVEIYNPATDTWKPGTDMPASRANFATAVVGGKIYAFGGISQVERRGKKLRKTLATIDVYDPAADAWQKIGDLPLPRSRVGAAELNGKMYLIGGSSNVAGVDKRTEVYDVAANQWKQLGDLNEPRGREGTASAVNGKIYAIGGFRKELVWMKTVEEYDAASDTWQNKKEMPTGRCYLPATAPAVGGKIYVMGGEGENEVLLRTVEEYDPAKNEWTKMAAMPTARRGLAVTAVRGKLYAIGGADKGADFLDAFNLGDSPAFATVEEFTPPGWPFAVSPQGKLATMWGTIKATD